MNSGWITLHRKIADHWLWRTGKPFDQRSAWLDILIEVNHADAKLRIGDEIIACKRGESLNSLDTWAKRWGWNKSKVRRFLKLLESDSMVTRKPTHKTTHLTVCNYSSYQDTRNVNETQVKRKRNASETFATPNNNNNNNDNNENNENKKKNEPDKSVSVHSVVDLELCETLKKSITSIEPNYFLQNRRLRIDKWPDEFRKIRELDGRDIVAIKYVLENFPGNDFWCQNIRSPKALRGETKSGGDKFSTIINSIRGKNGDHQPGRQDPGKYSGIHTRIHDDF